MSKNKISEKIADRLNYLDLRSLRELIDCCINLQKEKINQENLDLYTESPDIVTEYANILETKIIPSPILRETEFNSLNSQIRDIEIAITEEHIELQKKITILQRPNNKKFQEQETEIKKQKKRIKELGKEIEECKKEVLKLKKTKEFSEYKIELEKHQLQSRILERVQRNIQDITRSPLHLIKLNWKILPKGKKTFQELQKYLNENLTKFNGEVDQEKINKIYSLNADVVYCGNDEFEGYLVFYFENKKIAILDCPQKGNAIYIFGEEWEQLSRLTKSQLLNYYQNKTVRITHQGDWFERLRVFLKRGYYSRYL